MAEDEKIRKMIAKYQNFFSESISDVGRTEKGVWIFYEYDEENDCYNSFFRFSTAEELERIIIGIMSQEMNVLIESTAENIQQRLERIDINDAVFSCYDRCIPKLLKNVEILNDEYQKSAKRLNVIFRCLSGILRKMEAESS